MPHSRLIVMDLLLQPLALLHACAGVVVVLGLPGLPQKQRQQTTMSSILWCSRTYWCADVFWTAGIFEHGVDFLQWLPGGFGEHEVDVDGHCDAEDAEDDVGFPL